MGKVGELLVTYDYVKASDPLDRSNGSCWVKVNGSISYGCVINLPSDIKSLIETYINDFKNFHNELEEIERLKKELLQQEALDLWEEA